jgi:two-component system sensor kinase FixL
MAVQKYDIRRPDGTVEERHWSCINVPVLSEEGAVRWIIHRAEDVTELVKLRSEAALQNQIRRDQQRTIEELRAANAQLARTISDNAALQHEQVYLANIVESSQDAIFGKTLDGIVTSCNGAAEILFGYEAAELIGGPMATLIPTEFLQEESKLVARVARGEKIAHYETVRLRRDGVQLQVSMTLSPIRDSAGNVIGASTIVRDITAQKLRDEEIRALQSEKTFLADLVESSNDAIVSRTNDGKISSWNRAAELMFGFSAAEMIGRTATLPPELEAEAKAVTARLHRGEAVIQYTTQRPHNDGREIDVSFTASLIRNHDGQIVGTSGILRDITEQKIADANRIALQSELAHVSRLSAMGQMSAAIAHELNQPLSAISNFIGAAMRIIESEPSQSPRLHTAYGAIEKAGAQTFRAAAIIRTLRDFVERRDSARTPQNLSDLIPEAVTLGMLGHKHSNVRLTIELDPATPPILLNRVQIQQVLVNLVRNALEAMAHTDEPELKISSVSDTLGTRISVRDNGPGFSPEIAGQLFQPFVTTKETGMGIGLRICQSIVEAHGGTIEAASAHPGAAFVVYLPHQDGDRGPA